MAYLRLHKYNNHRELNDEMDGIVEKLECKPKA